MGVQTDPVAPLTAALAGTCGLYVVDLDDWAPLAELAALSCVVAFLEDERGERLPRKSRSGQ